MKSNKYKTNLAKAYAGLPVWSKKPSKLHLRMIRYLQRSVKGKSEFISSKKALNNWREQMEKEYSSISFDYVDSPPTKSIRQFMDEWIDIIKRKQDMVPDYETRIIGHSIEDGSLNVEISAKPGTPLFEKFRNGDV